MWDGLTGLDLIIPMPFMAIGTVFFMFSYMLVICIQLWICKMKERQFNILRIVTAIAVGVVVSSLTFLAIFLAFGTQINTDNLFRVHPGTTSDGLLVLLAMGFGALAPILFVSLALTLLAFAVSKDRMKNLLVRKLVYAQAVLWGGMIGTYINYRVIQHLGSILFPSTFI